MQKFDWGYYPAAAAADFPLQTVSFVLKNPAKYAGNREISLAVIKNLRDSGTDAIMPAAGTNYPYVSVTSTGQHIFSGQPTVRDLSIADQVPAGQTATFSQARTITLKFTVDLHKDPKHGIKAGTVFTLNGAYFAGSSAAFKVDVTDDSGKFAPQADADKCARTIKFTTDQDIVSEATTITLKFSLTSVAYAHNADASLYTLSATSYDAGTDKAGVDVIKPTPVPGDALSTYKTNPVMVPARVFKGYARVKLTSLTGGESVSAVKYAASKQCPAPLPTTGSATQTAAVAFAGVWPVLTTLDVGISGLAADTYQTCILPPAEGCTGSSAVAKAPSTAKFTVVTPPTLKTTAFTLPLGSSTSLDFDGTNIDGDWIFVVPKSNGCTWVGGTQPPTSNSADFMMPTQIAGKKITLYSGLKLKELHVCYTTNEAWATEQSNGQAAYIGKFTLSGAGTNNNPTVVVTAASGVYPSVVATLLSMVAAMFMAQRN
jgi:hypothetical protein